MPYKPNKPLKRMKTNLKNLKALFISMVVNVRLDINVIAITIIVIGDAILQKQMLHLKLWHLVWKWLNHNLKETLNHFLLEFHKQRA